MKEIRLNPLHASDFFGNLNPSNDKLINTKPPKIKTDPINSGEAIIGGVLEEITEKVDSPLVVIPYSIKPEIDTINAIAPNDAKDKTMKNILIFIGVIAGLVITYSLYEKYKQEKEKQQYII